MTQTMQRNHSTPSSYQFFNIEMSAIILLSFCVIWFFTRDIWINHTDAITLSQTDTVFVTLGLSSEWYDITTRTMALYSIFTITLGILLRTKDNIWIVPMFLSCSIVAFLYYHSHDTHFIIPPVTLFLLFTFYIIGFERFFLSEPSFINQTMTTFLFSVAGFFSLEMSLGIMPVFLLTAILCYLWKKHDGLTLSGGCFMVICGTICGIAGGVQFFGTQILTQDFINLSLPIFWISLIWAFYIITYPTVQTYKIPEPLLASGIGMIIFVCAIYVGHLDYIILNRQ